MASFYFISPQLQRTSSPAADETMNSARRFAEFPQTNTSVPGVSSKRPIAGALYTATRPRCVFVQATHTPARDSARSKSAQSRRENRTDVRAAIAVEVPDDEPRDVVLERGTNRYPRMGAPRTMLHWPDTTPKTSVFLSASKSPNRRLPTRYSRSHMGRTGLPRRNQTNHSLPFA